MAPTRDSDLNNDDDLWDAILGLSKEETRRRSSSTSGSGPPPPSAALDSVTDNYVDDGDDIGSE